MAAGKSQAAFLFGVNMARMLVDEDEVLILKNTRGPEGERYFHLEMTVDRAFILAGGVMADRELTYVQASRARGTTRWHVGHDLDEVTQRMTRSHEKLAAVSLVEGPELELTLVR